MMTMLVCGWIYLVVRWGVPELDKQRNEKLQRRLRLVLLAKRGEMEGTRLPVEMLCRWIRPHFHHLDLKKCHINHPTTGASSRVDGNSTVLLDTRFSSSLWFNPRHLSSSVSAFVSILANRLSSAQPVLFSTFVPTHYA